MCSIREVVKMNWTNTTKKFDAAKTAFLFTLSLILALTSGCLKETKPAEAVNRAPLIVDEAMQQRTWRRSVVRFQNGETPTYPTNFVLAHAKDAPKWTPVITDGPLFLANVFVMPIGMVFTPADNARDLSGWCCGTQFYGCAADTVN